MTVSVMSTDEARDHLLAGGDGPLVVQGRLDLRGAKIEQLPDGITCYELDATGASLRSLPADLTVRSRLVLDHCKQLAALPDGLTAGAISLVGCSSLLALPERFSTWFLDLSDCTHFSEWPQSAELHRGRLILRNCVSLTALPAWLGPLAQLDLSGSSQIAAIPDGITVSAWVDVGGTSIRALPGSLKDAGLRWRGVAVTEQIAFRPEEITASAIVAEDNAEIRRVMIDRMGYLRFARDAKARVLDTDRDPGGQRELLRINLEGDEPLVGLTCFCPSTGKQFFLRVPPTTRSCHQAAAWIAGFDDPTLYRPAIET